MKFKKFVATTVLFGTLFSTVAFAREANHGVDIVRKGPWAYGTAHTEWDRAHTTKLKIGINSKIASGVSSSRTGTVSGTGSASSGYWAT